MRVYLDICCLKRPFDTQSQPRIIVETAAVVAIIRKGLEAEGSLTLLRSPFFARPRTTSRTSGLSQKTHDK